MYRRPCFDSSFFIGGLHEEICKSVKRGVVFQWLWNEAKTGRFEKVLVSALTLAEVYKTKLRTGEPAVVTPTENLDEFLELIEEEFVEVIEIDRNIGLSAHALCRKYNLYPGDGIQVACAISAHCDVFFAWDRPLLHRITEIPVVEPSIYRRDLLTPNEIATEEEIREYEERNKPKASVARPAEVRGGGNGLVTGQTAAPAEAGAGRGSDTEGAQDRPAEETDNG